MLGHETSKCSDRPYQGLHKVKAKFCAHSNCFIIGADIAEVTQEAPRLVRSQPGKDDTSTQSKCETAGSRVRRHGNADLIPVDKIPLLQLAHIAAPQHAAGLHLGLRYVHIKPAAHKSVIQAAFGNLLRAADPRSQHGSENAPLLQPSKCLPYSE